MLRDPLALLPRGPPHVVDVLRQAPHLVAIGGVVGHQRRLRHPFVQKLVDEITLHQRPALDEQAGQDAAGIGRVVPVAVMLKAQQIDHAAFIAEAFLGKAKPHFARRARAPSVI